MADLSTQNYKGTRDFYPEDMRQQKYIFDVWRRVAERYGYEEYTAPLLELTDLYRAKTGEEIVNEQTYSFQDRGGRDVTIRPEMTPSLARMVAAQIQELNFPLRWYSIPNLWRYERPQHGRLREHWQLNVDIFGVNNISAELELIILAHGIMQEFGASDEMFTIRLNSRELMSYLFGEYLSLSVDAAHRLVKLLDRRSKMHDEAFINQADAILGDKLSLFLELLKSTRLNDLPDALRNTPPAQKLSSLAQKLHSRGISNIVFDITVQRGFDYYTGIVFEIFDTSPENSRALFGGGRYDELLQIFKVNRMPAAGFGMGDVTIADFLQTHGLLPKFGSTSQVLVASLDTNQIEYVHNLSIQLRQSGINVTTDTTERKIGTKIKFADKSQIPYVIVVGDEETTSGQLTLKQLLSGDEFSGDVEEIISRLS